LALDHRSHGAALRNFGAHHTFPAVPIRFPIALVALLSLLPSCVQPPPWDEPATAVNTADLTIAPDSTARRMLVDVRLVDPTIMVAAKYATSDNFTGAPLPGYEANRALLRREAAAALGRVQKRARYEGYALKIFDAYRPVRATLAMVEWTERTDRQDLLRDGYIASRSRHNLGVAVDLTLIDGSGTEVDMGTPFDTFSEAAHTGNAAGEVATNRTLLVRLMQAEGFTNYEKEWWHFSYTVANPIRFDLVIR
jgi:D-alanyl-D-alanine dipeptidase